MKVPTNRIKDVVNHYVNDITSFYGSSEARQSIFMLTDHFFGMDRIKSVLDPDFRLTESDLLTLHFAVKDLKKFKPIQYITGYTEFFGRRFQVNPAVLIPRPETEQLVQLVMDYAKKNASVQHVLDIGTGSGCIAATMALELPQWAVSACDVSEKALLTASENAKNLGATVHYFEFDLLHQSQYPNLPSYDVIVSNPPYVTQSDKNKMSKNVLDWEPHLALFVTDDDPLLFYKALMKCCANHLQTGGCILFEINELYGDQVVSLLQQEQFKEITLIRDFHEKNRFIRAIK